MDSYYLSIVYSIRKHTIHVIPRRSPARTFGRAIPLLARRTARRFRNASPAGFGLHGGVKWGSSNSRVGSNFLRF
jgi:hypothetical protein